MASYASKEIVLITGANTGLGFQIAKKLLVDHSDRFYVFLGSRTPSKGEAAAQELHDAGLKQCEALEIDVCKDESISNAVKTVEQKAGRVDVLHVNAGVAPDLHWDRDLASLPSLLRSTFETNVIGAAATAGLFTPLLNASSNPRVVFMSSGQGSLGRVSASRGKMIQDWPSYSSSKAALNMLMLWFAGENPTWRVNACAPGFRATQMNDHGQAIKTSTPGKLEDGALNAVRLSLLEKDGETGTFTSRDDATGETKTSPW